MVPQPCILQPFFKDVMSSFCPLEPDSAVFDSPVSKTCMPGGCGSASPLQLPSHPPRLLASHLHSLTSLASPHHGHLITAALSMSSESVPTGALAFSYSLQEVWRISYFAPDCDKMPEKSNLRDKKFLVALSSWFQSVTVGEV